MIIKLKHNYGFTLVELIIVITILSILSAISFISFNGYISKSRDSNRLTTINNIKKGLEINIIESGIYPTPDNFSKITFNGNNILKQGFFGERVSRLLNFNTIPIDPLSLEKYIYNTNNKSKSYQLLANIENDSLSFIDNKTYASNIENNNKKIIYSIGYGVGIIYSSGYKLIDSDLDLYTNNGENYIVYMPGEKESNNLSGFEIGTSLLNLNNQNGDFSSPGECKDGFIKVPGNKNFMQPGFCVAKYEMSYKNDVGVTGSRLNFNTSGGESNPSCAKINNSSGNGENCSKSDFLGLNGGIVSMSGRYPITDLTQYEAMQACNSIGAHLITNNEWMTISRNIENVSKNWNTGIVGNGYIYNGLSGDNEKGCSYTAGNTEERTYGTKTGKNGTNCDSKRELFLNNGESIWDLAGNIWEHVNKNNINDSLIYKDGIMKISSSSDPYGWDDDGIYSDSDMKKYGSKLLLGKNSGMGNLYYGTGEINNILIRGGVADYSNNTGIYSIHLYLNSSFNNGRVGFRCAY